MRHPHPDHPEPGTDIGLRRLQTEALLDLNRIRLLSERRVEALLLEHDLQDITPAQANALMVLFQARTPLPAARLAEELAVSEVTVGRFLRALEASGWVERWRDPSDSRRVLVRPSERARRALPRFIAVSNAVLDQAFGCFDQESIEEIAVRVAMVRHNLGG